MSQNATLLRLFITDCGVTDQGAEEILSALRTNKTLQQMQYGGQTKTANIISKQIRVQIDLRLRQNMQRVPSKTVSSPPIQYADADTPAPNVPPEQIEAPPGLGARKIKSCDGMANMFSAVQNSQYYGDMSVFGSGSNLDLFGQLDYNQRRAQSYSLIQQMTNPYDSFTSLGSFNSLNGSTGNLSEYSGYSYTIPTFGQFSQAQGSPLEQTKKILQLDEPSQRSEEPSAKVEMTMRPRGQFKLSS